MSMSRKPRFTLREDDYVQSTKSLRKAFQSIRNSGAYSDMTICLSDGTKVECHRAIMCARCDFFRIALESGFKESHTGVIEMFNDPPEAVHALIDFIYTGEYNFTDSGYLSDQELSHKDLSDRILFDLDVFIIARTYLVKELQELARRFVAKSFQHSGSRKLFQVLPDIAYAFEQLGISYEGGWGERYHSLVSWAWDRMFWLIKMDDIIHAMIERAPEFVRRLTELARDYWEDECLEVAMKWIERIEGPGSVDKIKLTFVCPSDYCDFIQDRYIGAECDNLRCKKCRSRFDLDQWMKHVQSSTDEAEE